MKRRSPRDEERRGTCSSAKSPHGVEDGRLGNEDQAGAFHELAGSVTLTLLAVH
jgi:hypothetical protein